MRRVLLVSLIVLGFCSVAGAQFHLGIQPIFSKQTETSQYFTDTFQERGTRYEITGGLFSKAVAVRGNHLFNQNYVYTIFMYDPEKKKTNTVLLGTYFCASDLEIGIPLFRKYFMVEPFFVNSYVKSGFSITGWDRPTIYQEVVNNTQGFGVLYNQSIGRHNNIGAKYWQTSKDYLFDIRYTWFDRKMFVSGGYTKRAYDTVKFEGPTFSLGVYF
jgi:hypothetical protein